MIMNIKILINCPCISNSFRFCSMIIFLKRSDKETSNIEIKNINVLFSVIRFRASTTSNVKNNLPSIMEFRLIPVNFFSMVKLL